MAELLESLNESKWQIIQEGQKSDYKEYHVVHQHMHVSDTSLRIVIQADDDDPKNVTLDDCKKKKDPLKDIGRCEIKLNADETQIIGIDVEGDIVQRKS